MTRLPAGRTAYDLRDLSWLTACIIVLALGATLRWIGLDRFPFEQDELYTLQESRELFATTLRPGIGARPLYYLLHHAVTPVLPASELGTRLPAFIFGLLGMIVTWRIGKHLAGWPGGLLALTLCAFSPWHLFISGEARYWSLIYLASASAILLLLRARESDRWRDHFAAGLAIIVGGLTHPTFVFPMIGVAATSLVAPSTTGLAVRWPTRRSLIGTWVLAAIVVGTYLVWLKISGQGSSLQNWSGRGWGATIRLLPAMVQLATPALVVAAALGTWFALHAGSFRAKRLGVMALGGTVTGTMLLLVASTRTDVYADYGVSMLPLVFVAATCLLFLPGVTRAAPMAITASLILSAATLPETASQMSDGMRFDYRPAFAFLETIPSTSPVLVWPLILQRHYAPSLRGIEFRSSVQQLDSLAHTGTPFWVIASLGRSGLVKDQDNASLSWLRRHCVLEREYGRERLDYRVYKVQLYACSKEQLLPKQAY